MPRYGRNPWTWFDFDLTSDPTVHVPYQVRLVLTSGGAVDVPALWVRLSRSEGVSFGPDKDGTDTAVPLADIASGRIDVVPVPADLPELRERYPWAYRMWAAGEAIAVHQWIRGGEPAATIAERLRRPPEHILVKDARVEALLVAARQLAQPMTPPHYARLGPPQPTTHHRYDPPPWYARAHADDPTVHWPFEVHLDLRDGTVIDGMPDHYLALTEDGVDHRGTTFAHHVRLDDITSGRVDVRQAPADLTDLSRTYRMAYQPWREPDAKAVLRGGRQAPGMPLEQLVATLARPPEHLLAKSAQLEATAAAMVRVPRAEPAPYHNADQPGSEYSLVQVLDVCPPRVLADRHGIEPDFFTEWGLFSAVLTEEQIEAVRNDPDVDYIEKDIFIELH
ncbi:protease inhibitor I9 family protein [Actinoplanes sp. NPDC026670]|uniref:protease inhibitor I9 family protein n=1 Tax=Actinoplanes sp. NPDC026670 TaxID=3154700 RepID=UPI00340B9CC4